MGAWRKNLQGLHSWGGGTAEVSLHTSRSWIKTGLFEWLSQLVAFLRRTQRDSMDSPSQIGYSTQDQWFWPSSDSEFYSTTSPEAVSPDCCLEVSFTGSPTGYQLACSPEPTTPKFPAPSRLSGPARRKAGRTRCRNPSKQRQSASEKEKLRMRDLTKALHHLRTYLPPSEAPAGQTLTKIETLRLAIRYINHLSAQLGHTEENLHSRQKDLAALECRHAPDLMMLCQSSSLGGHWGHSEEDHVGQYHSPVLASPAAEMEPDQLSGSLELTVQEDIFNSSLESLLESPEYRHSTQDYQIYNRDFGCQRFHQELWI
nr:mesoderm posterior protein 1-like [Paramormyrops kingsleyae]